MIDHQSGSGIGVVPSLLDRLVPDLGETDIPALSGGSAMDTSGLEGDETAYVRSVERDILWLFNTSPHLVAESPETMRRHRYAASSVLAYGMRHLFERVVHNPAEVKSRVEGALKQFEPRLKVESTSFKVTREGHLVEIEVKGELRAEGTSRRLSICTDLQTLTSELKTSAAESSGRASRR